MSWQALAWASKQRPGRASDKLILIALADRHNEDSNIAYPSIAWLCEFSDLNRKTVIASLQRLEAAGLIADSGQRVGKSKQIKAYSLAIETVGRGVNETHYTYRLTDDVTGEFYIGVRSFIGDPASDGYKGSGKWPTGAKFRGNPLRKDILGTFKSRTEAERAEAEAIAEGMKEPLCKNIAKESQKRDTRKTVPKAARSNSPEISPRQSQKRDTEPSRNLCLSNDKQYTRDSHWPEIPNWVPADKWNAFLKMRKAMRKWPTDDAVKLMLGKLRKWRDAGHDLGAIFDNSIENNWTGLFEPKGKPANDYRNSKPTGTANAAQRAIASLGG